jgi:hypothetical protein
MNEVYLTCKVDIVFYKVQSDGSLVALVVNLDFEVVVVLPGVDGEVGLLTLETDTVSDLGAKHELGAVHEVIHHVFKFWEVSFLVYQVEKDLGICSHLDPDVTPDVEDVPAHIFDRVVVDPVLVRVIVVEPLKLEELHGVGASCDQGLTVKHKH